jgi:HD-GYP domain-containing protein (c-di-GMP phosphodiesterase class II)
VVDSKSPYTSGHSARVALYTDLIAETLGLAPERRRWLKRGALLHDVGKLGVSNSVLDKPGKLDAEEWAAVQAHAAYTEAILIRIGAFAELAVVSAAHHERLDGKGYPRGLTREQMSLQARMMGIADIFEALTAADRPYKSGMTLSQALAIMCRMRDNGHIDPDLFEVFVRERVYLRYGEQFLEAGQVDAVDVTAMGF